MSGAVKTHKRNFQKKLNIQVKESNSRNVRVGHCCPSYLAPESSIEATCAQRQEALASGQCPRPGGCCTRVAHYAPTVIATTLPPTTGGTATGSVLLHGHFRVDDLAEKGHLYPVPTPGVEDPPPQRHMLFWCNAEISTNQTRNPKSITSRDWRNTRGKGMTYKDQTTKGTNGGTMTLASQEINHGTSLCLYQNRA